jgi:lipopolysaccharide/colanic/teichoic acid biosynthesis glycosyltransferase
MYRNLLKPALDFSFALVLCLATLPLLLTLSILIVLDSPGSPIFYQQRIGKGLKPFRIFKLRTMIRDAAQQGGTSTERNDPRITRVGKRIRRFSLDEIPQIWNVLFLQMSLIGPRPMLPEHRKLFPPGFWELRHQVRPGITGRAQCTARSDATLQIQEQIDSRYARELTLGLDLWIVAKTLGLVLAGRRAN